ncbi:MAG: branched-chain amino acid ABC transporter permease [Trueperaceae bacterium]|nr:MAG: branched-chain amino acid ABC transporter permease [Trueperaceae bacterium]
MTTIIILNGLSHAGLLFIMASGLTLAFGLMRVVNLAHGAFYLWGGYIGISVFRATGNWWLALLAGGAAIALLGFIKERILLHWVRGKVLSESLMAIGLATILADLALSIWGGSPLSIRVPADLNPRITLLGITYPGFRLLVILMSVVIGLGLWLLLAKTKLGALIRAGVDDRETTAALGINIYVLFTLVFMLSAFLAGIAGVIGGTFLTIQPGADFQVLTLALVVIIIGGMGSLPGAAIGALVTGLILSFGRAYVPELSFFLTFAPMAIILAIRPQGLFGRAFG